MRPALQRIQVAGELFQSTQTQQIFHDCKTFVDCRPRSAPDIIIDAFNQEKGLPNFELKSFIEKHFEIPTDVTDIPAHNHEDMHSYIQLVWKALKRSPHSGLAHDSLLPLPHAYIIPGGRFREIYYWDSYFTAVGLIRDGHLDLVESMIKNFAYLIRQYGHVPNGNRVYYITRSQPPMFAFMLDLLEQERGVDAVLPYVDALEREYEYWMKGINSCKNGAGACDHVVNLGNDKYLNRYWDPTNMPRPESYREDIATYNSASPEQQQQLYSHIRAACESGWDFSSRWLADVNNMASIRTGDIIPIDLNAYLYFIEVKLTQYQRALQRSIAIDRYYQAAENRLAAINTFCWDTEAGYYFDYCWTDRKRTDVKSVAGMAPLFVSMASKEQAKQSAAFLQKYLLKTGGLVTTNVKSQQQWDSPNGWAPMQWLAIEGLRHYEQEDLAREIAQRWLGLNQHIFQQTGMMLEKYNVCDASPEVAAGEYQLQFGFGWTNGVASALLGIFD